MPPLSVLAVVSRLIPSLSAMNRCGLPLGSDFGCARRPARCGTVWALLAMLIAGSLNSATAATRNVDSDDPVVETQEANHSKFYAEANYPLAVTAAMAGLARAEEIGNPTDQALFLRHLAYDHWLMGNSEPAIHYAQRLLDLAERQNSDANRSRAYRYLSQIYDTLGDGERARTNATASFAYADKAGDESLRVFAQQSIARCSLRARDFADARARLQKVYQYWQETGAQVNAANSLRDLADVDEAEGNTAAALAGYRRVIARLDALHDNRGLARALSRSAALLRKMGNTAEAMAQLERAQPLVTLIGGHTLQAEFQAELAATLEARGDFAGALAAERVAAHEREARADAQGQLRAADFEARRLLAQKQQALDRLAVEKNAQAADLRARDAELSRSHAVRIAIVGGSIAGALALGAIILAQRARLRAERRSLAESRTAQAATEELATLRTRLLGIASHDLKAPLRAIVRGADQIAREPHRADHVLTIATRLRTEGENMFGLVRDLVDVAALEVGRLELHAQPLDLAELAIEVVAAHRPRAEEKLQQLELTVPPDGPTGPVLIEADRARLRQAIDNLLSNALKFSLPGTTVRVDVAQSERGLRVAVRDEGPGLQPEDYARTFQPFQTLSARPTGGETSSGLGLYIAREIVGLHGGQLFVESVPGAGATFTIELPLLSAAPDVRRIERATKQAAG